MSQEQNVTENLCSPVNKPGAAAPRYVTVSAFAGGLVAVVALQSALLWGAYSELKSFKNQLAMTPPTVVVDFGELVSSYGDVSPEVLEQKMFETRDKMQKLKDAGYLVLDAANIVVAPDDVYLPVVTEN